MVDARLVDERDDPSHPLRGTIAAAVDHVRKLCGKHTVELAIEIPQVYRVSKGDPNDLITLSTIVGGLIYGVPRGAGVTLYRPREWKGQVPKEVTEKRARAVLLPGELETFREKRASLAHNVWDAVGLGLHHLRVTGRRPGPSTGIRVRGVSP